MSIPEFWIIAGPNGAGKTTLTQREPIALLIPGLVALNPDDVCLSLLQRQGYLGFADTPTHVLQATFREAAEEVFKAVQAAIERGGRVGVETVLSTDKYRPVVENVRASGGFVGLIYVALRSPELAHERVLQRVRLGGHNVPADRIAARWRRSLEQLSWFVSRVDRMLVYDNSDSQAAIAPRLIAESLRGQCVVHLPDAIPELTQAIRNSQRI